MVVRVVSGASPVQASWEKERENDETGHHEKVRIIPNQQEPKKACQLLLATVGFPDCTSESIPIWRRNAQTAETVGFGRFR